MKKNINIIVPIICIIFSAIVAFMCFDCCRDTMKLVDDTLEMTEKIFNSNVALAEEVEDLKDRVEYLEKQVKSDTATEKFDSLYIGELKVSQPLDELLNGKVALFTDSSNFGYYTQLGTIDFNIVHNLKDLQNYRLGDTLIIHSELANKNLVNLFNEAINQKVCGPDIIILLKDNSGSEAAKRVETLIKHYTEVCCNTMIDITVMYTDGMQRVYEYRVE